jgi:acetyltransferase-like isoleucine patch superfamily enzyme
MTRQTSLTLTNNNHEPLKKGKIYLQSFSKIVDSHVSRGAVLGDSTVCNRSKLGKYFSIGAFSYLVDSSVGAYCTFGSRVSIGGFNHPLDWLSIHEFQYRDLKYIFNESLFEHGDHILRDNKIHTLIGSDVWISDNAAIKRGINIGHGAIIGLGAVITKDVPPYAIVVGNPGKILRWRFPDDIITELLLLKWWELDIEQLRDVEFRDINAAIKKIKLIKRQLRVTK